MSRPKPPPLPRSSPGYGVYAHGFTEVAPPPLPEAVPFAVVGRSPAQALPYRKAAHIVTKGERAFRVPLLIAIDGKYELFCKVRLADVICCPRGRRDEDRWFKKIGRYHVDFVLCDPVTTEPKLVIELDDRRHRERQRKERDQFKDDVLRAAGMPILRISNQQAYAPLDLAEQIECAINQAK